ncbi:hypothetical protein [Ruegeria sp.]|uniref:hypothetical protein n=1 Tax=Ruegeria sp. TaxID=1879320 RepID=UPI003AFFDEDA
MARISIRDLKKIHGISQTDIDLARETQKAQKRADAPVLPIAVLVGVQERRRKAETNVTDPDTLLERQLRKRGVYDRVALVLDREALVERSPERAMKARELAQGAKGMSATVQLEFDFLGGGNVSIAFQYQDAVTERLFEAAPTTTKAKEAMSILWTICRHLGWQSYECTKTASQLCEIMRTHEVNMSQSLKLLEEVGAIQRIKRGRVKVITVTPEGAFRGNINDHGKAVERYKLDVIEGGATDD